MEYTYNGIQFSYKTERSADSWYNMVVPRKHKTLDEKKPDTKGHILYDSIYMKVQRRQTYMDGK